MYIFLSLAAVVHVFVYISSVSTACISISLEAVLHYVCLYTYTYNIIVLGTWVCGESWLAIKDSVPVLKAGHPGFLLFFQKNYILILFFLPIYQFN